MNRRSTDLVLGLALAVLLPGAASAQTPEHSQSFEKRSGAAARLYHEKTQTNGRPDWVGAAVDRAREHLAAAKEEAGLDEPEAQLVLDTVIEDDRGRTRLLFGQVKDGIPIFAEQIVVDLDEAAGNRIFGRSSESARAVSTVPVITGEMATRLARSDLGDPGKVAGRPTARLVILPAAAENGNATLAWLVTLAIEAGGEGRTGHRYLVSAEDGRVVMHYIDPAAGSESEGMPPAGAPER